jgi:diguanylate cyclase (GGDEF)-like protein
VAAILFVFAGLGMHLLVFEDMTYELRRTNRRLEAAQAELRQLVITDALTGCFNRRHFEEIIGREIQRHRRYEIPLSLVFVDVDHFKAVNDSLGHEAGDRVLKLVARVLVEHVRQADYVFRWGGDEFLVLMSCAEEEARDQSQRLREAFVQAIADAGLPPTLGLSVGCVEMPDHATNADEIVRLADQRMYLDKWRGKKRTVLSAGP